VAVEFRYEKNVVESGRCGRTIFHSTLKTYRADSGDFHVLCVGDSYKASVFSDVRKECGSEVICDEAAVSKIQVLEVFDEFEVFETVMKAVASVNSVVFLAVSSFLSF
jgi:hypothetical protein